MNTQQERCQSAQISRDVEKRVAGPAKDVETRPLSAARINARHGRHELREQVQTLGEAEERAMLSEKHLSTEGVRGVVV